MSTAAVCGQRGNDNFRAINNAAHGRGLVARKEIWNDQFIASFADAIEVDCMDIYTMQIDEQRHVRHWIIDHLNHSCDANVRLDTETRSIVATRHILAGEELSFFYPSTEWQMWRPFPCECGSKHCIGRVAGAKCLSWAVLSRYHLTPHIVRLYKTHNRSVVA